jgi:hypothetical protein
MMLFMMLSRSECKLAIHDQVPVARTFAAKFAGAFRHATVN